MRKEDPMKRMKRIILNIMNDLDNIIRVYGTPDQKAALARSNEHVDYFKLFLSGKISKDEAMRHCPDIF